MLKINLIIIFSFYLVVVAQLPNYCGYTPGSQKISIEQPDFSAFPKAPTLIQVQVLFRHGDRTVAGTNPCWQNDTSVWNCNLTIQSNNNNIPTQEYQATPRIFRKNYLPNREYFPGNCMTGQLTSKGLLQEQHNGQIFRQAYIENQPLLSPTITPSELYLRTDDCPRTIASLQGVIDGLYPVNDTILETNVINFNTMDFIMDDILPNANLCPNLGYYTNLAENSIGWTNHIKSVTTPLLQELETITGITPIEIGHFYDCLNAHLCHEFTMPSWFTQDIYNRVNAEVLWQFNYTQNYPNRVQMGAVSMGLLINEWWNRIQDAINNESNPCLFLYSGHDYSVMPFAAAFGIWNGAWAYYASFILFELYDTGTTYLIRAVLDGVPVQFPGCSSVMCDISEFTKIITPLIPTQADCFNSTIFKHDNKYNFKSVYGSHFIRN